MIYFVLVSASSDHSDDEYYTEDIILGLKAVKADSENEALKLAMQAFDSDLSMSASVLMQAPEGTKVDALI